MNCNRQLREVILDVLTKLLVENEFELVLFHYNMPPEYLSKNVAQTKLAIELVRYAENQPNHIKHLLNSIFRVKNEALERSAILNKQTTVLLSYTCDSDEHLACVLSLLEALRQEGIDCRAHLNLDGHKDEEWLENQIECSDFVLLLFSESYRKYFHQDSPQEPHRNLEQGAPISQVLYKKCCKNENNIFIPLVIGKNGHKTLPLALPKNSAYKLPNEYEKLLGVLKQLPDELIERNIDIINTYPRKANNDFNKDFFPEEVSYKAPFIAGLPVRSRHFFARTTTLQHFYNLWKDYPDLPLQSVAIWGEKRIGKTSLLTHLRDLGSAEENRVKDYFRSDQHTDLNHLSRTKEFNWVFIDLRDIGLRTRTRLLQYIISQMHFYEEDNEKFEISQENPLTNFYEIMLENLEKPTIILFDEIDEALIQYKEELSSDFWGMLYSLLTNLARQCLGFVISSTCHPAKLNSLLDQKPSSFFNIFSYAEKLNAFSFDEAKELVQTAPFTFSAEDVEFILEKSQRKPYFLQYLCLRRTLAGENAEWREEAEKNLNIIIDSMYKE